MDQLTTGRASGPLNDPSLGVCSGSPADPSFIEYAKVMGLRHDFTWKSLLAERSRFFLMTGEFQHFGKAFAFIHYDLEHRGKRVRYRRTVLFSHLFMGFRGDTANRFS